MGILSGLGNFGLSKFENADIYENEKKEQEQKTETVKEVKKITDSDFLFDKTFPCPVCGNQFTERTMKSSKAKLIGTDVDLRARYENIDPLKYDVIACPSCGYAALSRFYKNITAPQAKLIKENISRNFTKIKRAQEYSYDDAIERYQLALANAVVKRSRASEKAYICLKMAWLVRGKMEGYDLNAPDYDEVIAKSKADEAELLQSALEGFLAATSSETFPMCGMDEITVDYIIAVTAARFDKIDIAAKLISKILGSPSATSRMKDKARELKEQIIQRKKGN